MLVDSGDNIEGHGKGAASVFECDGGPGALLHRFKKRLQFRVQRLFCLGWRLRHVDLRIDGWCSGGIVLADAEHDYVLATVVERNVLPGLKEAKLADALGRDAAGGEVGNAAGVEFEANICDVHLAGKNGEADCTNFFDRRIYEAEHNVEVVNHQVEDNIDVERARREYAEAMHFEKHGPRNERKRGADRRIEALQVSHLANATETFRKMDEFVGFGER